MSLAELFATEDKIDHKIDLATLGFVTVKANNDYVTVNSFVAPNTTPLIQRAVDAASNGWTVNVNSGTYNENVTVDKELTLLSGFGSVNTIIDGNNSGSELGTIFLPTGSNNVTIGSIGHGFTVKGIDGPAGIEKAAIYLQGTQSNIVIENNVLDARGDAALQGEWNAVNNNITINANEIIGQTFTGTEPATGDQFSVPNVARQAIAFGGDASTTNTQNFTFTNNVISAITGVSDKGNGLVTLDLVGTNKITGNIFSGQTGPYAWRPALRVRGTGTYIINENSFSGNYQIGLERIGTNVDGTCNWWGSTSGNDVVSKIVGDVNYVSWLIDGTDNSVDPGFQPVPGSCLGTPVVVVLDSYTDETCLGSADGTININISGGTAPYSILWSNNATSEDLTGLPTDTYNLVVTDDYGTTATLAANVVIGIIPDVTPPTVTGTMTVLTADGCVAADATAAVTTVAGLEAMGAEIEDNCTDDILLVVTSEDASSGTCPIVVTRTYTLKDLLGNESTITQTINVQDVTAPTITCPADITVHMNDGCNWVGDYGTAAATDNCTAIASIQIIGTPPTLGFVEGDNTVIWKAIDACGNVSLQCEQIVTVETITLSGTLTYNISGLPLNKVNVNLLDESGDPILDINNVAVTDETGANGGYEFTNLCAGTYIIEVEQDDREVGYINATDAGATNAWGASGGAIEYVNFLAGDVNDNLYINHLDAQRIQQYFVFGTPFDRKAWSYWTEGIIINSNADPKPAAMTITVSGADVSQNILAMATGDFNGSFGPTLKSAGSSVRLSADRNMNVEKNQVFNLPLRSEFAMEVGAVSLILDLPSDFAQVMGVKVNGSEVPASWTVKNNELRIGWNSLNPVYVGADEALVTLNLKSAETFGQGAMMDLGLVNNPLNELADGNFNPIRGASLLVAKAGNGVVGVNEELKIDELSFSNYPNPFNRSTTLSYAIPVDGKVNISIYNQLGQLITSVADVNQRAGHYTIENCGSNLLPGMYVAKLRLTNEDTHMTGMIKLNVVK